MKLAMVFTFVAQLAVGAAHTRPNTNQIAILTNTKRVLYGNIKSIRLRKFITQSYLQCASGYRNPQTDPICHKVTFLLTHLSW